MSHSPELTNIAIVGATGTLGSHILPNLLDIFPTITVLSRPDSDLSALTKNDKIVVKRAASDDHQSLVKALEGVDALIITQGMHAPIEIQLQLCDAAVEAGVKWILPNEYGSDTTNAALTSQAALLSAKHLAPTRIVERAKALGKNSHYIRLVTNGWYDWSLPIGFWGIDVENKTATFYNDGEAKTNTTTLPQVGLAIARLLALPVAQLEKYNDGYGFIRSFELSQRDILDSVSRVTQTPLSSWKIQNVDVDAAIEDAKEAMARGEFKPAIVYGNAFKEGRGGLYGGKELSNKILGLPELDLDTETRRALGL